MRTFVRSSVVVCDSYINTIVTTLFNILDLLNCVLASVNASGGPGDQFQKKERRKKLNE